MIADVTPGGRGCSRPGRRSRKRAPAEWLGSVCIGCHGLGDEPVPQALGPKRVRHRTRAANHRLRTGSGTIPWQSATCQRQAIQAIWYHGPDRDSSPPRDPGCTQATAATPAPRPNRGWCSRNEPNAVGASCSWERSFVNVAGRAGGAPGRSSSRTVGFPEGRPIGPSSGVDPVRRPTVPTDRAGRDSRCAEAERTHFVAATPCQLGESRSGCGRTVRPPARDSTSGSPGRRSGGSRPDRDGRLPPIRSGDVPVRRDGANPIRSAQVEFGEQEGKPWRLVRPAHRADPGRGPIVPDADPSPRRPGLSLPRRGPRP
jgi:hypothetical protein